jgi:predicted small metal-binding protein
MTKQISCNDIMPGCEFKAEAATEQELLEKVARHAADVHDLKEITPEVLSQVRTAIRDA